MNTHGIPILILFGLFVSLGACKSKLPEVVDKSGAANANAEAVAQAESKSLEPAPETAADSPECEDIGQCSQFGEGQTSCRYNEKDEEALVTKTLPKLGISRSEVSFELVDARSFGCESLLVIPARATEEFGAVDFDAHVVLVENVSGEIVSRHVGKQAWTSDSIVLRKIEIEPKSYDMNGSDTFGVKVHYRGESRPNPYETTDLNLYVRAGKQLERVLKDHMISFLRGETDIKCEGEFEAHEKSLEVMDSATDGYADLRFRELREKSVSSVSTDQKCERSVVDSSRDVEVLRFNGGAYEVQ